MSGKVPRSKRARAAHEHGADYVKAAKIYEDFTGHQAEVIGTARIPQPKAAAVIGHCDGVLYTTVRDGVEESYIHKFLKRDRPVLAVDPTGKQLFLLYGNFRFTDRGIVDNSSKEAKEY